MEGDAKEDRLLLVSEVAERLRLSTDATYELVRRGEIPSLRLGRRAVRVPERRLREWIEEQTSTS